MNIGEVAKRSGLNTSRIRFYEAKGLLNVVERTANGYRQYPPEVLLLLNIIASAQQAGFSLDEIRRIMPPPDLSRWQHGNLIEALRTKIADIEAMQKRLTQAQTDLRTAIRLIESRPSGMSCAANTDRVMQKFGSTRRLGSISHRYGKKF